MEEPRTFLRLWHIAQYHYRVVERMLAEERFDAAVGRQGLVFQFLVVDELRFINEQP